MAFPDTPSSESRAARMSGRGSAARHHRGAGGAVALRGLGVRLAMDDFGTGFSSVCCLMQFRFDKIKIDESLVWSLGDDDNAWAIVRAVVGLSDSLHICSNAEGVETQHQAALLLEQGCNEAQGHLYGKPISAEDFLRYIGAGAATPQPLLAPAAATEA